jgi:leucyl aminopeptidase (aminopeptidase T)
MPDQLSTATIDAELLPGARNAIRDCLRVKPEERVTIITDEVTQDIAAALQSEIEEVGAESAVFVLENYAPRPLIDMPQVILDDLATSQVSIFASMTQFGELRSRIQMTAVVNKHRIRHGHMVNITREIMLEGMRANFLEVDKLSQRLVELARMTERVTCRTAAGTDYVAEISPTLNWLKTSGIITRDKWGNLPGGEIFTVALQQQRRLRRGRRGGGLPVPEVWRPRGDAADDCRRGEPDPASRMREQGAAREFRAYTSTDENSNRVGEFAVGTNTACTRVIGNILQDEKIPGIHIAFGHLTRSTLVRPGFLRRTSIAWAVSSTSGSMTARSWNAASS